MPTSLDPGRYAEMAAAVSFMLAALIVIQLSLEQWLLWRQARYVRKHRDHVPVSFASRISLAAHHKAADYTAAKTRLAVLTVALDAALLLGWTLLGGLDALNTALRSALFDPAPGLTTGLVYQVALILAVGAVGGLAHLPLAVAQTFGVEQRFGFNRMTARDFIVDGLKNMLLSVLLMAPLLALVLWLMQAAGSTWWIWAFAALASFQLLVAWIYPTWIAPWFNRFTPLQDPALESRVRDLMQRCGFHARELLVMDGSRRSAHSNAYFTGLGRHKRVVFFDTLLKALNPQEVEAVLAHELGHFHHRHIVKRLLMMMGIQALLLAALGQFSQSSLFYVGLGVTPNLQAPNEGLALALFMLVMPTALFFLGPLAALRSRQDEYQADAYAAQQADRQALASALVKLHEDNASTLTPDPWFVRFHYSHPPAEQRLRALGVTPTPSELHATATRTSPGH